MLRREERSASLTLEQHVVDLDPRDLAVVQPLSGSEGPEDHPVVRVDPRGPLPPGPDQPEGAEV